MKLLFIQKMKLNVTILLLLSLLLFFTKQETKGLVYKGETITDPNENINELVTYKISASNKPTYLKITTKGKGTEDQSKTNHIISYYQNGKNINEREQLSQSETETTIMYLNKNQLKSDFYISVQCRKYPCSYDFVLESKEYAELNLEDSFSYYVTESNQQMKFNISGIPNTPYEKETATKKTITIYAIGNLEINTELGDKIEYIKHKKYNAYLIKISELNKLYEFILTIKGKPGDLINVGSHFHDGSEYSISHKTLSANNGFIFGYLKKNIKPINCFKVNYSKDIISLVNDIENPLIQLLVQGQKYNDIYITCVSFGSQVIYISLYF